MPTASMTMATRFLTPRTAGWAVLACAGIGIVGNALLAQEGSHPAPWFQTRTIVAPAAPRTATSADSERITRMQRALTRLGFYSGPIDGISGPATQAALLTFWSASGRTPPAANDWAAIEAEIDAAVAELPETPPVPDPRPDARVLEVQRALARAAYGPLETDGVAGPATAAAIRRFQEQHGLTPTGEIDSTLVARLVAIGAMADR